MTIFQHCLFACQYFHINFVCFSFSFSDHALLRTKVTTPHKPIFISTRHESALHIFDTIICFSLILIDVRLFCYKWHFILLTTSNEILYFNFKLKLYRHLMKVNFCSRQSIVVAPNRSSTDVFLSSSSTRPTSYQQYVFCNCWRYSLITHPKKEQPIL